MINKFLGILTVFLALLVGNANAAVIGGTPFTKVIHVAYGPTATQSAANSGNDYSSPKGFYDGDLMNIPKDVIITNIYVVCDTAVSGITAFNLGDDDAGTGFVVSASPSFSANSLYYWDITNKGTYFKLASTTLLSKYYAATGKELKLDVTGTATAGKLRIFVTGFATGLAQ